MKSFIRDLENPERKLIDKIIEIICHCVEIYDENVHLQIIKSSLTAVTSCDISSTSFSNAFLACFNIFLITRNQNNQSLSRVILNQMTNLIFQRYETVSKENRSSKVDPEKSIYNSSKEIVMVFAFGFACGVGV